MTCSRRDALYTIGLAAASTVIPACGGNDGGEAGVPLGTATMCGTNLCFKISENPELQLDGGIVLLTQAPGKKILVQRMSEGVFVSLSAICTHAGCTVVFNGSNKFNCPCHGSSFNADGSLINGPATRPLPSFATAAAGDDVTITLA